MTKVRSLLRFELNDDLERGIKEKTKTKETKKRLLPEREGLIEVNKTS